MWVIVFYNSKSNRMIFSVPQIPCPRIDSIPNHKLPLAPGTRLSSISAWVLDSSSWPYYCFFFRCLKLCSIFIPVMRLNLSAKAPWPKKVKNKQENEEERARYHGSRRPESLNSWTSKKKSSQNYQEEWGRYYGLKLRNWSNGSGLGRRGEASNATHLAEI